MMIMIQRIGLTKRKDKNGSLREVQDVPRVLTCDL